MRLLPKELPMPVRLLIALCLAAAWASQALPADRTTETVKVSQIDTTETRVTRTIEREEPIEGGDSYFVHTWVLDFVGLQNASAFKDGKGFPVYRVVHTSEGPYEAPAVGIRVNEIASKGLMIGTSFWPLDRVQRVEVRSN